MDLRFRLAFVSLLLNFSIFAHSFSSSCGPGKECLIDLPGGTCADGTPAYYTLTQRPGAKKLLIYLSGGGGCWNRRSCEAGLARQLTRIEKPTDWQDDTGIGDASDALNPFREEYDIITVPYCTGDAYTGNNVVDYGTKSDPYVIRHVGYSNMQRLWGEVKQMYPDPEQVTLMGCSAGGIGANFHLRGLSAAYPDVDKVVISDAGTPFRPPFLEAPNYQRVMQAWGADQTLPLDPALGRRVADFGELLRYNSQQFPDIRYSLLSSYGDQVMTFFAFSVGARGPLTAVRRNIIDVANNYIGRENPTSKVFFLDSTSHCQTPKRLGSVKSEGTSLGEFLTAQVNHTSGWKNVRPDLQPGFRPKANPKLLTPGNWSELEDAY